MKRVPYIAAFLIGANAISAQSMLLRELLVNFSGNELSMGIIIATWLTGSAAGSLILGRMLVDKIKTPKHAFSVILIGVSLLIPAMIFLSRTIRYLFRIPVYDMLGPLQIILICAILLLPISALLSLCFIITCRMLRELSLRENAAGTAYILEALGATIAGAAFTFVLIIHLGHFQIAAGLLLIDIIFALSLLIKRNARLYALLLIPVIPILINTTGYLQRESETLRWHPYKVADYESSPYGNISVTETAGTYNVYENGTLLFTTQDEAFNEEFSHLVMLQHASPENILFLGSGIGGCLRQVLKHNPESLTYLQLDPTVLEVSKKFLLKEDREVLSDPRLKIVYADANFFLKRTKEAFDVIIVDMPDPLSLSVNRFYTKRFYETARLHLNKGGILATRVSSNESIISDELARYDASVYNTLKDVFEYVELIPGENLILIASDNPDITAERPDILVERLRQRRIETNFLTQYHIRDRYYPDTLNYLRERLKRYRATAINTDLHPISFYYGLMLWNIKFQPYLLRLFRVIERIDIFGIAVALAFFMLCGLIVLISAKDPSGYLIRSTIAATGAAGITLEVVILLSFQVSYGYVYSKAGFLIALFMLGLAFGSYIINRKLHKFKNPYSLFCCLISAFCLYIISAPFIIKLGSVLTLYVVEYIFYLMVFTAGVFTGFQFPVAVTILQKKYSPGYSASVIWGYDLLGAAAATLIASLVIIPLLGMPAACFISAGFCVVNLILMLLHQRLRR